jgi:hypothetical protein
MRKLLVAGEYPMAEISASDNPDILEYFLMLLSRVLKENKPPPPVAQKIRSPYPASRFPWL